MNAGRELLAIWTTGHRLERMSFNNTCLINRMHGINIKTRKGKWKQETKTF